MPNLLKSLRLTIDSNQEADQENIFEQTINLKKELQNLEITSVDLVKVASAPPGTKAGDPVSSNSLLLTLAASGGVFTTLITAVFSWLRRNNARSITLEIDGDKIIIKGVSETVQERLITAFIKRHIRKE
jgi:hypothetical protein